MQTIHRANTHRTVDGSVPGAAIAGQIDITGVYLTNEVFLYWVVGVVAGAAGKVVELEDCFLLDVVRVPLADLLARRLRVVASDRARG